MSTTKKTLTSGPPGPTDHLAANRTLILSRAVLSGLAGMVPVPYLDDLIAGAVRSHLIKRVAEIRSVDLDNNAVHVLSDPAGSRVLTAAGIGALAIGGTKRIFRRIAASIFFVRRVDEAIDTFHVGTLFDHYCAKHHVGLGLDGERAALLRHAIDLATKRAQSEVLRAAFRRAMLGVGRAAVAVPAAVWGRLFAREAATGDGEERVIEAEKIADSLPGSAMGRAVRNLSSDISAVERTYVALLLQRFDVAWAATVSPRPTLPPTGVP
jgi:hypothetical protein